MIQFEDITITGFERENIIASPIIPDCYEVPFCFSYRPYPEWLTLFEKSFASMRGKYRLHLGNDGFRPDVIILYIHKDESVQNQLNYLNKMINITNTQYNQSFSENKKSEIEDHSIVVDDKLQAFLTSVDELEF